MLKIKKINLENIIYLFLIVYGVIYILNAWSPSSYGLFLEHIKANNTGIIWGTPRAIRSDEWAVVTPLTQALINNDFQQFNATSLYNENFRINYGLPIFDWGMIFKPTMWGYLFLSPAYAYSLQWFLTFSLFIIGYFKLFTKIKLNPVIALGLTLIIYFSGYSQFWWNEKGPIFMFFPWLILVLISQSKLSLFFRLTIFYWIAASWFITNFYPPVILSLAFVAGLLFLCYGQYWFKWNRLLFLGITSILAIGTALFYLQDYLLHTMQTVYPGTRNEPGGTVPIREFISQFQPFSMYDRKFNPVDQNISEIGVVALPFILMCLFHLNYRSLNNIKLDKFIVITGIGLVLMLLWMLAPIPATLGKIFLWNNIQPERMEYAEGIVLGILACYLAEKLEFKISLKRFVLYSITIIVLWFILTKPFFGLHLTGALDLFLIPTILLAYLLVKKFDVKVFNAFVIVSALILFSVNIRFNPIQSAKAIFEQDFAIKKTLDKFVNKDGVIAYAGFPGATLNGLGYKSVTHVTAIPQLDFWKSKYSYLSEEDFNKVFNRYSHIILNNEINTPISPSPDQVHLPLKDFYTIYSSVDENSKVVEQRAENLSSGEIIKGRLNVPNGKIKIFSILIGNHMNTSDGILNVTVCSHSKCSYGNANLKDSIDNNYFSIALSDELLIENNELTYELSILDSSKPVAIWKFITGDETSFFPKINLFYF